MWETDTATDIIATNYFAAFINFATLSAVEIEMIFEYFNQIQTPLNKLERKQILKSQGEHLLFDLINLKFHSSPLIYALNLSEFQKKNSPTCFICNDYWFQNRDDLYLNFTEHLLN